MREGPHCKKVPSRQNGVSQYFSSTLQVCKVDVSAGCSLQDAALFKNIKSPYTRRTCGFVKYGITVALMKDALKRANERVFPYVFLALTCRRIYHLPNCCTGCGGSSLDRRRWKPSPPGWSASGPEVWPC